MTPPRAVSSSAQNAASPLKPGFVRSSVRAASHTPAHARSHSSREVNRVSSRNIATTSPACMSRLLPESNTPSSVAPPAPPRRPLEHAVVQWRFLGLWRSWERVSMALRRSGVRLPPGPPNLIKSRTFTLTLVLDL